MRTKRGYWCRACYSKGVNHHQLHLAETQSQAREQESFIVKKKRGGGSRAAVIGGCWQREAGNSWLEAGIFMHWFGEHIWLSLTSPELEVKAKKQESWPSLTKSWLFGADYCRGCGSESIVIHDLAIVCLYIQSLSIHTSLIFTFIFILFETFIK